jgi:two-component system chemotaxis response regulator CheY
MFPTDTKILVIDDMLTMRKLVKKSLNGIGFNNVSEATDGDHAWNEIQTAVKNAAPFSLIISDWNMPKMTGIDLLKKVRAFGPTKSVPFILLTAEFDRDQVVEAIKAGLSGYITKPFSMAILSEKLQSVWAHMASSNKT